MAATHAVTLDGLAGRPVDVLCAYEASTVPQVVLAEVEVGVVAGAVNRDIVSADADCGRGLHDELGQEHAEPPGQAGVPEERGIHQGIPSRRIEVSRPPQEEVEDQEPAGQQPHCARLPLGAR